MFPCGLLFSRSNVLLNKEHNDVNRDLANYSKSLAYSYKPHSFTTFSELNFSEKEKKQMA